MASDQTIIDEICMDLVDADLQNAMSWYVVSTLAQNEHNTVVISAIVHEHLKQKILANLKEFLGHPYIEHVVVNDTKTDLSIVGSPPRLKDTIKTLLNVSRNCERHSNDS